MINWSNKVCLEKVCFSFQLVNIMNYIILQSFIWKKNKEP